MDTHLPGGARPFAPAANYPHPSAYLDAFHQTGPGTLCGTYMRQFWQVVGRAVELPPGKAKPIKVMSVEYTLYRGASGKPYVVDHNCPHRGTQLSVGWVEGEAVRCLYHGWKFDGNGTCVERPGEKDAGKIGIRSYPTHEFLGLIYTFFGEGEPPAFPPYPAFEGEGLIETLGGMFKCNYFQSWENDWDLFHARYTHVTGGLHTIDFELAMSTERYDETDYGVSHFMKVGPELDYTSILLMPCTVQLIIPTFNEQRRKSGHSKPMFRQSYLTHVPVDDYHNMAYMTQLVPVTGAEAEEYLEDYNEVLKIREKWPSTIEVGDRILQGLTTVEESKMHPMLIEIEDQAAQVGQGRIANRHAEHLGRTDVGVIALRRILSRELHALAEGRPTKDWAPAPLISIDAWNQVAP